MKALRLIALALAAVLLIGLAPATFDTAKAEGEQPLPYWIGVDVRNQRVTIYRTADNSVVHRWLCSTGLSSTPTPTGVFYLPSSSRKEWAKFGSVYVKYPTRLKGGYFFHSVLFSKKSDNSMQHSTLKKLGHAASHGCIRLEVQHAKWISENVAAGTKVIVHKGVDDSRITAALGGPAGVQTTPSLPAPPVVTGLALDKAGTVVLGKGETLQLSCAIIPSNATTKLTWKSSKSRAVTVNGSGLVTAVGNGVATITVTASNGVRATVKVESVDKNIARSVALDKTGVVTVNVGETLQLNATLAPATAVSTLTWKTSKARYATVDANGLVTGVAKGSAKITVITDNRKKATVTVKVVDPYAPLSVKLAETGPLTLHVGETLALHPTLAPDTAKTVYTWTSSKKKVAVVDASGVVTALRKGTAKITVKTSNKKKAVIVVKVVD